MSTHKLFILAGSVFGALAVAIGAFGAHVLKRTLEVHGRLDTFETAVKYHFYHALALLLVGLLLAQYGHRLFTYAGLAFILGIVLFSGSLYTLALTGVTRMGMVAPFGGLGFIAGWILLFVAAYRSI